MGKRLTWAEKIKARKEKGQPIDLITLLELAKSHTMTPAEIKAQRRSWVIGQMMLSNPHLDKASVEAIVDGLL